MTRLSITLFGKPQLSLDGIPLSMPTTRAMPLIAYLAMSGSSQSRETVANLLWSESSQRQSLAALRTTLWRLKSAGLENWINFDRNLIELNQQRSIDVDVLDFKSSLEKCNNHGHVPSQICLYCTPPLTEAVALYKGEFLAGINISKAPIFDDWRMQQSEALQTLYLEALERLVKCHRTLGDFNLAIHYARLWLNSDRLNENANYQLLQLYSITGQRTAGIALYKRFKEVLSRELGVEPAEELTALYKQVQTGQAAPLAEQAVKNPVFLIAEVENPDSFWAEVGPRKSEVLAANLIILRDTARRFGGRIIQRSDENITLLFENGQPLHCAVTLHMKIKKADWGEAARPPSIRMVLYSTPLEGEYLKSFAGLTRTASSLLTISWGGQVVFSEQTYKLLDMPSGARVKDLGFHFIDDIDETVHVYELQHPNLPQQEHPPLQSRTRQLVNFPNLTPAFIGRERELEDLVELIKSSENRLISLVGPGGIGKTRLAVQLASQVTRYFPEGVYFISLASVREPEYIPILLAAALKFTFYGPENQIEQLAKFLHRMKALVVVDNFEHLRVEGARLLAVLLAQTHYLKLLVTTRERLNMIAETILEVHGLSLPADPMDENAENYDSVRLFIQNAERTFPNFTYKNNLESITRICHEVDGAPLGILLASSWVRVFSCPQIANEIKQDIDFLSSSAPDIDKRHRSLRAVFDHSWVLLTNDEARILRRLSVFRAAFTAHAAQEICDATQLSLAVLADKSLLYHLQDNRYEMLATFQQYAAGKLEEDKEELSSINSKFCDYYLRFCLQEHQRINTSQQLAALAEMTSEMENIRTAWNLMVDSDRWNLINRMKDPLLTYHVMIGNSSQGRELYRSALSKLNKLNDQKLELIRACMMQLSAWMTFKDGYVTEGIAELKDSLKTLRGCNSPWDVALTLMFLSEANRIIGNKLQAREYIEEALEVFNSGSILKSNYTMAVAAHCQTDLGLVLIELGDFDQARQNMNASLATHTRLGTYYGTIHPLMGLGRLAFLDGEFIQARDLFLQAMDTATQIYDRRGMALLHNNLASVYEEMVNTTESYHHVTTALKLSQETGDRRLNAVIINNIAFHQLKYLHQPTDAIRTYQECLGLFTEIGDLRGITYTCYDISRAYLLVGLVEEAWRYCLTSLHTAITLDDTSLILHSLHGFVYLFSHLKDYERALRMCYLIIDHPAVEQDTRKRAIVSRAELETLLPAEAVQPARLWGQSTSLQDAIDQIRSDPRSKSS